MFARQFGNYHAKNEPGIAIYESLIYKLTMINRWRGLPRFIFFLQ